MQTREPSSLDPNSVDTLLQKEPSLQQLCDKARQIQAANAILAQQIPRELHAHCKVANVHPQSITLYADHAVWATQLRYQQMHIIAAFQKSAYFGQVESVKVRVLPQEPVTKKPHRAIHMSKAAGNIIENTASGIQDPKLKEALLRLSKNSTENKAKR